LAMTQLFLVFVRTAALTFFLPGFGESYVSIRIKLVVAGALAALVFPMVGPNIQVDPSNQNQIFGLIFTEAIAMGHIMVVSGLALISIVGLHETYLVYVLNTYAVTPVGLLLPGSTVGAYSSGHIGKAFALAFQLSAAALTATLLYNIVLGVINRAMPQLLVSFVGAPALKTSSRFRPPRNGRHRYRKRIRPDPTEAGGSPQKGGGRKIS